MKIKVKISPDNSSREVEIKSGLKVYDLLKKIQIKPDTVLVLNNNSPIPVDEDIVEGLKLKIIRVASGG